jgi:hypothetical protein
MSDTAQPHRNTVRSPGTRLTGVSDRGYDWTGPLGWIEQFVSMGKRRNGIVQVELLLIPSCQSIVREF